MSQSKPNIIHDLKVNRLPSLPNVLVEMLRACENNQASFQELSQIISRDSVISGRVIFLANSSFYNPGTKITTLERALFLLGTDTIKTIVITASIQQFFSAFKSAHSAFLLAFWRRSLTCALLAKSLAILTSYPEPDEVYLTGLLHNIGELVLDSNHPGLYDTEELTDAAKLAMEKQRFNFTHAQVGACLAKEWGLSQFTCDAIEFHHADSSLIEDAHHLVKLVYLASYLSHPEKQTLDVHDNIASHLFELNAALVNQIVIKIESEVREISRSLGLDIASDSDHKGAAIQQNQEKAKLALAKHVKDISLIQNAMGELNRANNQAELGNALQNSLSWLYGLDNSAVFWFSAPQQELCFHSPDDPDSFPIKMTVATSKSLVAKACQDKAISQSFGTTEQLTIVDSQLLNYLKTEGFVVIPIQDQDGLVCALIAGINEPINPDQAFTQFLAFFAKEAASNCRRSMASINAKEAAQAKLETPNPTQLDERLNEVIHEANNPLNIISNYLHSLGERVANNESLDSGEVSKELSIVREEVQRTSQILLQLKDLKHEENGTETAIDMNAEISSLCTIYKTSLFLIKSIHCQLNLDPKLNSIGLNRNAFKQILTNLIRNAAEALPEKGRITISTNAQVNLNGHNYVGLSIEDNGPGMPDSVLKNLFKPVVSTKGNGHSGLGLSITKNLVKDAKGTISCRSSENGTLFQILLPRLEQAKRTEA